MINRNERESPLPQLQYVSPFEIFKRDPDVEFIKWSPILGYKGSLQEVLVDLEGALQEPNVEVARFLIAVHPPRAIRATIDYKIDHPELPRAEEYVRETIRLGLAVYKSEQDASLLLQDLKSRIISQGDEELLYRPLVQEEDGVTWEATDPALSLRTAQRLTYDTNRDNLLFIA